MRFVVLTRDQPQHRYVANVLCERHPVAAVIVDEGAPTTRRARLARLYRRHGPIGMAERGALKLWGRLGGPSRQRRDALARLLGARGERFARPELITRVRGVNSEEGQAAIAVSEADVLLVYGTGIVGDAVLALPRILPLNLHTGISPHYRGADCAFWPLHDARPELLGATVHECTSRVDGGRVFGTVTARLHEDDDVESVFVRCVMAGARLYADVVAELPWDDLGRAGVEQDLRDGREHRAASRGLRAELVARRRLRDGLLRTHVRASEGVGGGDVRTFFV